MSTELTRLEAVLRRDRLTIVGGLVVVGVIAWSYLVYLRRRMGGMETMAMAMPDVERWGAVELLLLFAMWAVMMVAMMVPAVAPLVLIFARAGRQRAERSVIGPASMLMIGYLTVLVAFSTGRADAVILHRAALMSPAMVSTSSVLGGTLLLIAGAYQFTPLKGACLTHCRSPLHFLIAEWGARSRGSFAIGLKHGAYCVGCCWNLMAILLVAGVMNLLWVAAISVMVLVERVAPRGEMFGRAAGALLVVAGIAVIAG